MYKGTQVTGFDNHIPITAKGKLPRKAVAIKIAGISSNGIGRNAQNNPIAIPLAELERLKVQSSGCLRESPKI